MSEESANTPADPLASTSVTAFNVTCGTDISLKHLAKNFAIQVNCTLSGDQPAATLSVQQAGSDTPEESVSLDANATSGSVKVFVNASMLEKTWEVNLSFSGGESYQRRLYFGWSTVYPTPSEGASLSNLFPEQALLQYKDRIDVGVCLSGGGTRALVLGMGQLRFLSTAQPEGASKNTTYINKIGYLSSVSGGSWATSIYSYAPNITTNILLGNVTDPKDYGGFADKYSVPQMALGTLTGFFAVHVLEYLFKNLSNFDIESHLSPDVLAVWNKIKQFIGDTPKMELDRFWIDAVGMNFFYPNHIYDNEKPYDEAFTLDFVSKGSALRGKGSLPRLLDAMGDNYRTLALRKGALLPYPIINSVMLRPTASVVDVAPPYIGYEYTPLYHGPTFNGTWPDRNIKVGGGNAEMFSYGQYGVDAGVAVNKLVMHQSNVGFPSLAVASGTSSSAYAGATSDTVNIASWPGIISMIKSLFFDGQETTLQSALNQSEEGQKRLGAEANDTDSIMGLVSLLSENQNQVGNILNAILTVLQFPTKVSNLTPRANYFPVGKEANTETNFGDAGLSDNFGLMALLRRKVKKAIIFVNSETEFVPSGQIPQNGTERLSKTQIDASVSAFYGVVDPADEASGIRLSNLKVFGKPDYDNLIAGLKSCRDNNLPLVVAQKGLNVAANPAWDVEGGSVDILWVYNSMSSKWTDLLDEKTKNSLNNWLVKNFPYVGTMTSTLGGMLPIQTNMLAHLAYWNLEQSKGKIDAFLNG